jgi:hypothetical protein
MFITRALKPLGSLWEGHDAISERRPSAPRSVNCSAKQAWIETVARSFKSGDERPKPTAFWAFRFVLVAAPYYLIGGSQLFSAVTISCKNS